MQKIPCQVNEGGRVALLRERTVRGRTDSPGLQDAARRAAPTPLPST
ncbi:hypothetical protein AB0I00_02700 [Streptomyces sp. NPDC050803]